MYFYCRTNKYISNPKPQPALDLMEVFNEQLL